MQFQQQLLKRPIIITEPQFTDALSGKRQQRFTERCINAPVNDVQARTQLPYLPRCHPLAAQQQIVQPAAATQAHIQRRLQHVGLQKTPFGFLLGEEFQELLGRHTHPLGKQPLHMKFAQLQVLRQFRQGRLLCLALSKKTDSGGDSLIMLTVLHTHPVR